MLKKITDKVKLFATIAQQNWPWILTWLHLWCLVHCPHKKNPFCRSTYPPHISVSHTLNICSWDPPGDPPWSISPEWCPDSPVLSIVTGSAHLLHFQLDNHSWNVCTNQYKHCHHLGRPVWCWPTSCRYLLCSQCKPGCRQCLPHNKQTMSTYSSGQLGGEYCDCELQTADWSMERWW